MQTRSGQGNARRIDSQANGVNLFAAMHMFCTPRFLRLLAAIALFAFAGDLAADAVTDMMEGHCDVQSSQSTPAHDQSPCSHCACAIHAGAVVVTDFAVKVPHTSELSVPLPAHGGARPIRLAGAIDHPPQLA